MSDDHSSLDELADLDEGELEPSRVDSVRAHLVGCQVCRARHQALRDVHDELAVLPAEPMPEDVVKRVDRALAEAALPRSATVVPLTAPASRRKGWPALAGVAAVVVLVAFLAAVVVGHGGHGNESDGAASSGSGSAAAPQLQPTHFTITTSPKTYNHTSVVPAVRQLVSGSTPSGGTRRSVQAGTSPFATGTSPTVPKALIPLTKSAALLRCAASLTNRAGAVPLAVEFARYTTASVHNAPSALFVFAQDPTHVAVYVAGPSCSGLQQVRDFLQVPIG